MLEETSTWYCPTCGEENTTFVDVSAGSRQSYIEDCQICCRPAILKLTVDFEGEVWIEAISES
jgi:hypothetical protein